MLIVCGINLLIYLAILGIATLLGVMHSGFLGVLAVTAVFFILKIICSVITLVFTAAFDEESPEESYHKPRKTDKAEIAMLIVALYIGSLAALFLTNVLATAVAGKALIESFLAIAILAIPLTYFFFPTGNTHR